MTITEIRTRLRNDSPTRVAEATGLSRVHISDIKHGKATNLTQKTIDKLTDYINKKDK